jgi:outer membrane protein OmpA-like peptidoglycan-associated protein
MKRLFHFLFIVCICPLAGAQTARSGDREMARFQYAKAIRSYVKALKKNPPDSVQIQEKIAECYAVLNDPFSAEVWYKKALQNGSKRAETKFALAQQLRKNGKYEEARKALVEYKKQRPGDESADDIIIGFENLKELLRDRGVYELRPLSFNTAKSHIAAAQLHPNTSLLLSAAKRPTFTADWKTRSFYKVQLLQDSAIVKKLRKLKVKGYRGINSVTVSPASKEVIFAAAKMMKINDVRHIQLKLFSVPFEKIHKKNLLELPFNSDSFSNAHPSLSPDGNTLYFASDRPGGRGGSDLYVSKKINGRWSEPKNLGNEVNTPHNETYPFAASDGTLYFSSDGLDGLGGYDVYRTYFDGKKWRRPENLGSPINSNFDDFALVIDSFNRTGFVTSNRKEGRGSDDVFAFTFQPSKLDYKILVKVREATSLQPLSTASASVSCQGDATEFKANQLGEIRVVVKGFGKCKLDISAPGYKTQTREISRSDAGTWEVELKPDVILLQVQVKEKESGLPISDASITLKDAQNQITTFVTGASGTFDASITAGDYRVFSNDYQTLSDRFSSSDAANGIIKREYLLSKKDFTVGMPLLANCFTSVVTVTDLKSGEKTLVKPDANGEVRLELKLNNKYVIEHNQRQDTIHTQGLFAGDEIEGLCKYRVGQKWIIQHVFYDLNKAQIRKDATAQLDELVRILKENPSLQIELSSHTDCRGTAKYNDILSLQRAKAAIDYIVSKGIRLKRLVAAGFGERKPVNDCRCEPSNQSPCSEEQHQANRRTEVKVLKY